MRKFTLLFILIIISCSIYLNAYADTLYFKNKTLDELISIREELNKEIALRGIKDEDLIRKGIYKVGENITAGKYEFTLLAKKYINPEIIIYETEEDMKKYKRKDGEIFSELFGKYIFSLSDGEMLEIYDKYGGGVFEIKEITNK